MKKNVCNLEKYFKYERNGVEVAHKCLNGELKKVDMIFYCKCYLLRLGLRYMHE